MPDPLSEQLQVTLEEIDFLFQYYAELFKPTAGQPPDRLLLPSYASILHSFYTGIEGAFLRIAKDFDRQVPSGGSWHRDLLEQMTRGTPQRSPVLPIELAARLRPYMDFRHFYRHSYSYILRWDRLSGLVEPVPVLWTELKSALESFIITLSPFDT